MMTVGACTIELRIPGSDSLKAKRRVVKSLKERVQGRFHVAIAEVDRLDDWQRATLGVACVSNDSRLVDATLSKVVNWIEVSGDVLVVDYQIDLATPCSRSNHRSPCRAVGIPFGPLCADRGG